jgi:hypothetical protein
MPETCADCGKERRKRVTPPKNKEVTMAKLISIAWVRDRSPKWLV